MEYETKTFKMNGIKVTTHTPLNVPEAVKQQKINALYDLLKPKNSFVVALTKDKRYTVNGNAAEVDLYAGRLVEQLTGEAHCFKGVKALRRSYKGFQKDFLFNVREGKSVFCTVTSDRKPDREKIQKMGQALEKWLKDNYRFSYAIIVYEPLDDGSWHFHLVVCFEDEIPANFEEKIREWASSYNDKPSDEQVDVQLLLTKKDVMRVWAYLDPTSPKKRHRAVFYEKGMKNFSVFRSSGAPKSLEMTNAVDAAHGDNEIMPMNMLSGYLYCADCGAEMTLRNGCFYCGTYRAYSKQGGCTSHTVRADVVEQLILAHIQAVIGFAKQYEDEFLKLISSSANTEQNKQIKALNKSIAKANKRLKELETLIAALYEDKVSGEITAEMFNQLSKKFTDEQSELRQSVKVQTEQLNELTEHKANTDKFLDTVRKYTEITELTPEILAEFIDKVVIHQADKSTGKRTQQIDIYFKGVGRVEFGAFSKTEANVMDDQLIKEKAKELKREYMREYRKAHAEERKQAEQRYWERKAREALAAEQDVK